MAGRARLDGLHRLVLTWCAGLIVAGVVAAVTSSPEAAQHVTRQGNGVGSVTRSPRDGEVVDGVTVTTPDATVTVPGDTGPSLPVDTTLPSIPTTLPPVTIPPTTVAPPPTRWLTPNCLESQAGLELPPSNAARAAGEVAGRVTGPCGRPSRTCVHLHEMNGTMETRPGDVVLDTATDANGVYRFTQVPAGIYHLSVGHTPCEGARGGGELGLGGSSRSFELTEGGRRTEDFSFHSRYDFRSQARRRTSMEEGSFGGFTRYASIEAGEPRPSCLGSSTAWGSLWETISSGSQNAKVRIDGITGTAGALALYVETGPDEIAEIGCLPLSSSPRSFGDVSLAGGRAIWLQVVTLGDGRGGYQTCDLDRPAEFRTC